MADSSVPAPLVRCGGCGEPPVDRPLRRGRCYRCYEKWVRARSVGENACCAGCADRRRQHLRHFELGVRGNAVGGRWVVLCHNCAAVADKLNPSPRSVESLKQQLYRDRRWGERRGDAGGVFAPWLDKRRSPDRRKEIVDATDIAEIVIEFEAEYEEISADKLTDIEEVTGIHQKIPE
jgi:hypothetical protein